MKFSKNDQIVLYLSLVNLVFFHAPLYNFILQNLNYYTFSGIFLILSISSLLLLANAFIFYLFFSISDTLGRIFTSLLFFLNIIAIHFINLYGIILDESMMENIWNTNSQEAFAFISTEFILFCLFFGSFTTFLSFRIKFPKTSLKILSIRFLFTLIITLLLVFSNGKNWLWVDKNAKHLGALVLPWSYTVNSIRYFIHQAEKNEKEILLPNAKIKDSKKSIFILVIGESARKDHFSLYGYSKNTNPILSTLPNLAYFNATAHATYTREGVKAILSHKDSPTPYESLPNYLYRNGVEVIWRTSNTGEPIANFPNYQNVDQIHSSFPKLNKEYDAILLTNLKKEVLESKKDKIFVVLHTSTSHGPTYYKKYPLNFEVFKPVCSSVELSNCSQQELFNAYDNTILYTDFLLSEIIHEFKDLPASVLFVSDHGESLGENNLYMHGIPKSFAPKEQLEIPFLLWSSDSSIHYKSPEIVTQFHVFHTALKFLNIDSEVFQEDFSLIL
ncbi:MAG: hypothetical protein RIR51_1059 [Bacteroidota bacterium]